MAIKDLIFTILGVDRASSTFRKVGRSADELGKKLDGIAVGSAKSLAGLTAAAAAAPVALGAALGGVPLLFLGIGAAAAAANEDVQESFSALGQEIKTGVMQDAAPLAPFLVGAAEEIGTAYRELRPQFQQAFAAAGPQIAELTEGVTGLARGAMPGLVDAVTAAGPVFQGLSTVMARTGRGVSDFFTELTRGADDAGTGLEHLGELIEGALTPVASLLVELTALWAEHGDEVSDVLTRLLTLIADLASGAMPAFSSSIGIALQILSGMLSVLEPLADVLGPMAGVILTVAAAWRTLGAAARVVDTVSSSVQTLSDRTTKAVTNAGGLAQKVGLVTGALGGPLGIALTAVSAGLILLGKRQEQAAAEAAEHAGIVRNLASALRESGGAITDAVRRTLAQEEATLKAIEAGEQFGLTADVILDAALDQGNAFDQVKTKLEDLVEANRTFSKGAKEGIPVPAGLNETGKAAQDLLDKINALNGDTRDAISNQKAFGDAVGGAGRSLIESTPGAEEFAKAMTTLKKETASTADKVDALNTAWRRLFGVQLDLKDAQAAFEEGLDQIGESIASLKKETADWQGVLFNANGTINLANQAGRELHSNLSEQGEAYRALAVTVGTTTLQQTKSQEKATAAVAEALAARRAQFLTEMQQMGFNETQAKELADEYLKIPTDIATSVTQPGMLESLIAAAELRLRVLAVPDQKLVTTRAEIAEAMANLNQVGLTVRTLPDGRVEVTALTDEAEEAINHTARQRTATILIDTFTRGIGHGFGPGVGAGRGTRQFTMAAGGILEHYSHGGLRPMSADFARIVPPRSLRVIGDRASGDEAFIPINGSPRSRALLAETARRMGVELGRVEKHFHLTVVNAGNDEVDLRTQFRRLELLAGG
ncbi:hypothetical protein GCM10012275_38230 [Longimycelium tulufanense]|uniref:Uncharacterized protein n=1 Tax=Longimycelium tulufanense TaxID=907463 RepID=A0A8J3FXM5_9PSEU|nr:hypothetical protein [Longimycelium tulufanense]GGM64062.1 hypothetical protein GCM10012275_38230 [Longimycelium tulufanense]